MMDSITVVIQMTGLLLIVPPNQPGREAYVLLPFTHMPPAHAARIGFALEREDADLCVSYERGICYVDLDDWRVDPIGKDEKPTTSLITALQEGVVNLTEGSGGLHTADVNATGRIRARLRLAAGRATNPCHLALWRYTPVGTTEADILPLTNVLNWEIRIPEDRRFELVFRHVLNRYPVKTVTLAPLMGRIALVIAHVPRNELQYLPPSDKVQNDPHFPAKGTRATHFHEFYNLLGIPDGDHHRRRLPRLESGLVGAQCPVEITVPARGKSERRGIKTYGCMVAAAELKP